MASEPVNQLHILLIPYLAPGHTIPMIHMAKLFAQRPNVIVTIVTTPLNAIRYGSTLQQHIKSGLSVRFLELPFPATENGLPEGCESLDALPGLHLVTNFTAAVDMLQQRLEQCFDSLNPRPSCMLSDKYLLWTGDTAAKCKIPLVIFDGMSCFKQLCTHHLYVSKVFNDLPKSEPFVLPGLPDRIEITRAQLPTEFNPSRFTMPERLERVRESESRAYGMVINSFEELEQDYVNEFKKLKRGKVWCIGPLSLSKSNDSGKSLRGNSTSSDDQLYLKWLDSKEPGSVVYACFGSISQITPPQLIELGLALEASKSPFIWVIRAGDKAQEVEKWLSENGFENRIKDRGLIIRDWAPQLLILSHPSVGGFLTHCGWNSVLEGVSAGVPMITWPQFTDQFLNEKLVVHVLGIGVGVGAPGVVHWGEEDRLGVTVKSEQVKTAIEKVMDPGSEGNERRKKAKALGMVAKKAIEEGGSSHHNLTLLIQDLLELANVRSQKPLNSNDQKKPAGPDDFIY
ncbi:putative UDP-glucuronosyl/UDP-glucosyltransferase, UDP-glycosyltransferase family [Helianthus annuus]|uniref:Glycosyltransferase n=1 Tax=Helianthus annuus TaxID=4232 RepID=A0A9K3JZA8_HELAN|nr:UDP-glycosyltransferase 73C6-like [Helianthus annuus]KAF5823683.1 putative UDP-glucuronosyl/UDP-glucosyltransferase, UDP-glycosyltransferase family [Helianthus annuus]KAJ0612992.1 putative UDP-glucuronosyl/UDP-glucosyltransferase, UDP-glycosyltransferase family [Helianthus annuus]KAJ0628377.1 putative UDP-glucuronosyl/UDP-glucosyltransferase, UDP-glycosyltransferase family [Helianthus annuus]KAJ0793908.1 putative UDP-glucuronosyl/UDP-glucosyltransferase, UDP-glycosyltransferase family [Helia